MCSSTQIETLFDEPIDLTNAYQFPGRRVRRSCPCQRVITVNFFFSSQLFIHDGIFFEHDTFFFPINGRPGARRNPRRDTFIRRLFFTLFRLPVIDSSIPSRWSDGIGGPGTIAVSWKTCRKSDFCDRFSGSKLSGFRYRMFSSHFCDYPGRFVVMQPKIIDRLISLSFFWLIDFLLNQCLTFFRGEFHLKLNIDSLLMIILE